MRRSLFTATLVFLLLGAALHGQTKIAPTPPEGILPVGADGRPLNLDFETGTLKDWTAEGDAFAGQPVRGDTVFPRHSDNKSQHQGSYWIGGYELRGDKPQGTLTSVPFTVTQPWGSFLVGGGPHLVTCVELVRKDTGKVFHRASGYEEENLRREVVDLQPHLGKEIFIRLVDRHSGHWGHINFDDFRFHAAKPNFPPRLAAQQPPAPLDNYKYAGLPPKKAAEVMTVPEGFRVTLFAGEPDVHQPIAFCLDDRGRVWVAEAYCYPIRRKDADANDRIVLFEDTDGDGVFDKRTVFMEGLNLVSGLEVGHGGVWIGAAPYFMFVPMKDDKPAGPPQILLDGWGWQDTHETLNTFTWGPDGWLYGCHGVFTHSRVGKPGTPDAQRTPINAGIWRYHPKKHLFEVFAQGTSNPWGLDFNDRGQAFCEACVIPHCFHVIQGARYHRQAGPHFNLNTFADIPTIADHRHYVGATPHGGNERSDSAGGGHAHCGTMIYLGGAWPKEYRDRMFMGNIHGRRLNVDILRPKGSGYVASHGPDFLLANDAWARFINFRYGPDGNVYLIDWYDKQACHTGNPQVWDRTNGRVYKISYRGTKPVQVDLSKKTSKELAALQTHDNDWYVRHARRLLAERGADGEAREVLENLAFAPPGGDFSEPQRLRGLWALHGSGGLTEESLLKGLADDSAYVRAWCVQLGLEDKKASPALLKRLEEMAESDSSQVVRLYLASAAGRLPFALRWKIMDGLLAHADDAGDHNLPLMYWYAAEPLGGEDPARALGLAARAKVAPVLAFMARRIAQAGTADVLSLLANELNKTDDTGAQLAILRGMNDALKSRRDVPMPKAWVKAYATLSESKSGEVRSQAVSLAVIFGDPRALDEMRRLVVAANVDLARRKNALESLKSAKDKQLVPILYKLVTDPDLRGAALRALAVYDDPRTPAVILGVFPKLRGDEKRDALATLAARAGYASELMEAVAAKKIAAADVSADVIRQLRNLGNKELAKRIGEVWGAVRDTPADRAKLIAQYRKTLSAPAKTDVALGRAVFVKTCVQCHVLFGTGGKVGPDITGANRQSLDYLLENIFDPSAVIPKEYAATVIELNDGRVITGIVKAETPATLTVATATETLTVPQGDVASKKVSDKSMMPDDLVKQISDHELRALVAYLQSPGQVPLLATADNAKDLFNGKDLTGWDGDPKLWRVENGEIVGHTTGLGHNEFLRSHMIAEDFRLTLKVKLVPDKENSGIQFRSEALPGGEVKGPQADIGAGWWGKLYEEHGRGLLWKAPGDQHVKKGDWNEYTLIAQRTRIRTFINGQPCVDLDDVKISRRGLFAFQLHSGGPMEVRFKEIRLEVNPN
jgi:putative membrane-bound dehydrogenase-like protein